MNSNKKQARIVGVFFILAAVSAVVGLLMYDPILSNSDYLTAGAEHSNQILVGAVMELILVVSAIGTAVTMFPYLKKYDETIALWHVSFRFFEAVIIAIGIISVLALLTLSQEFIAANSPNSETYHASGTVLKAIHDWTFLLGPNFMLGINTMMYSYIFYKSKLVPRFIPMIGMIGAVLVFSCSLLVMFDVIEQVSVWGGILALPVAVNEMTLAVWLILKGFNETSLNNLPQNRKQNAS
ncbi:DUF4386 domain-containing protein [Niallia sp. BSM11]|uniref:DUF4386 domain-containing protein n=1 Tax=Niallia sp. BSM11 TaxID=3391576 RepID=UPI00398469AE